MEMETRQLLTRFFQCSKITSGNKLDDKEKQIEQKSKIDKAVVYKGNQKQLELNAQLDTIIKNIETKYSAY